MGGDANLFLLIIKTPFLAVLCVQVSKRRLLGNCKLPCGVRREASLYFLMNADDSYKTQRSCSHEDVDSCCWVLKLFVFLKKCISLHYRKFYSSEASWKSATGEIMPGKESRQPINVVVMDT